MNTRPSDHRLKHINTTSAKKMTDTAMLNTDVIKQPLNPSQVKKKIQQVDAYAYVQQTRCTQPLDLTHSSFVNHTGTFGDLQSSSMVGLQTRLFLKPTCLNNWRTQLRSWFIFAQNWNGSTLVLDSSCWQAQPSSICGQLISSLLINPKSLSVILSMLLSRYLVPLMTLI